MKSRRFLSIERKARSLGAKWIKKSTRKNKKFMLLNKNNKIIHFGDNRYKDFTQHKDQDRRRRYLVRATNIKDKNGKLTANNPDSPNYYSIRILWN
jgi:acid phosphatase class B